MAAVSAVAQGILLITGPHTPLSAMAQLIWQGP